MERCLKIVLKNNFLSNPLDINLHMYMQLKISYFYLPTICQNIKYKLTLFVIKTRLIFVETQNVFRKCCMHVQNWLNYTDVGSGFHAQYFM